MTEQVITPADDDVEATDPADAAADLVDGDQRRARRCGIYTTIALFTGGGALGSLAAGAAMAGDDSPIAEYLPWIVVGAVVLFAAAVAFWVAAIRMRNHPGVQLAWAVEDRRALAAASDVADRQIAAARKKLTDAREHGWLPPSAHERAVPASYAREREIALANAQAWVTERDGADTTAPDATDKRRPSPRARRTRVAA